MDILSVNSYQLTDELKKKIAFVPCNSKEALHNWINIFLELDIPDNRVDDDSTCSPMEAIWNIYRRCKDNDLVGYNRTLSFASRDGTKTLSAAVLEVLMICHLDRDVAHLAAIEAQAQKAQSYVKAYLSKPYLKDFVIGDNKREVKYVRYCHKETGENLTEKEWNNLASDMERSLYHKNDNYINVLVATMSSVNFSHVLFMVIDECELIESNRVYDDAKMIPASRGDRLPITLITSSRKYAGGRVQKEIDEAIDIKGRVKLHINHWNAVDMSRSCPPERHHPELGKIPLYYSKELLKTISKEDYEALPVKMQEKYIMQEGFHGCLHNCHNRLFPACQGRLATKLIKPSMFLKPIEHLEGLLDSLPEEHIQAQLYCWRPSRTGMIYPHLERQIHIISAAEMASMVTGEEYKFNITKEKLIETFKLAKAKFVAGMDFGFVHPFAACVGAVFENTLYIFDALEVSGMELMQKIEMCDARIKQYDPMIYPDPAYPSDIKTFRIHGYQMSSWKKKPGSVLNGIEVVRLKINPGAGKRPEIFFLKDDLGCENAFKRIQEYRWKIDVVSGEPTDTPEETGADMSDAIRYLIWNVFGKASKANVTNKDDEVEMIEPQKQYTEKNWFKQKIAELVDDSEEIIEDDDKPINSSIKWFI